MYRTARIRGLDLLPYLSATSDETVRTTSLSPAQAAPRALPVHSPISEDLRRYIQDVCAVLKRAEPDYSTLDQMSGKTLLEEQLLPAYRALLSRSA
jgi:hypothetical protein